MAKEKEEKPTPLEGCQEAIQAALEKYNCSMIARPGYQYRDDGSWSLLTNIEIVPSRA